jgi:hypothetical protein
MGRSPFLTSIYVRMREMRYAKRTIGPTSTGFWILSTHWDNHSVNLWNAPSEPTLLTEKAY